MTAEESELAIWEYRGLQDDTGTLADYERSSEQAGDAYALQQSFGVTVPEHYATVEQGRSRLRAERADAASGSR